MICERCVQGNVLDGEFHGRMETGVYLAPAPSAGSLSTNKSKTCVVVLTDIFGLPLKNCKIVADAIAEKLGVDVWIPDLFAGSPC
jgi:carboxymethylenebutenolidase